MNTQNAGSNYGNCIDNVNLETGIHYGIISQNEILQAWADSSEPIYIPYCPYCGNKLTQKFYDKITCECTSKKCPHCKKVLNEFDFQESEPQGYTYNQDGYICQQSSDNPDIFVCESQYYTYAAFCSPCTPNAGYLMTPFDLDKCDKKIKEQFTLLKIIAPLAVPEAYKGYAETQGFIKTYCFGHDWFEGGKAPYPVFNVKTGEIVKA